MRRNNDEFINEVFQRSEKRIVERNRRMKLAASLVPAGLCVALLIMIGPMEYIHFPDSEMEGFEEEEESLGSDYEDSPESDESTQEGIGNMSPETEDGITDGEDGVDSSDDLGDEDEDVDSDDEIMDGIIDSEAEASKIFRGMMILDIDGDTITLVDESGEEVVYIVTQEGIYDVSKEEYLKLSVEEEEFWKEILAIREED